MSDENEKPTPDGEETKAPETSAEKQGGETPAATAKIMATITSLREKNPKAFYGGIAAVVLVLFGLMFFGGGGGVQQIQIPTVQVGQTYKLVNPNVTGGGDVLLLQAPGRMGATDPELREKEQVCVVDAGTSAKVLEQNVINYVKYAKVQPLEGGCAGKQGWTSIVNLKAQ